MLFEISANKGLRDVILGSEKLQIWQRTITQFWRGKYVFVYYSNVQRTFKDNKIKSTVFTRPHAMKRHKSASPMLRDWDLSFWTPVNFEVEYFFFNEETEGVLTDTVIYFYDQHLTRLSQLKPNAKVG